MIRTPLYYRRFGVRRPTQIMSPRLFDITTLQLPRSSVYHYLADSIATVGPSSDGPVLSKTPKINYIIHVTDFEESLGNPRPTFKQPNPMIMEYRRKNRRVRPVRKIENAIRDPKSLLVVNYSILPITRKYIRNRLSAYYEWYNITATMFKGMETMAVTTANMEGFEPRNQFFMVNMPDELPSLNIFRMGSNGLSRKVLEEFNNNDKLTLLDMWRWVGPNPEQSLLWKQVSRESLDRIFFILKSRNRWLVINLGMLDQWVKRPGEEDGVDPITFQIRFYNFLSKFYEVDYISNEPNDDESQDLVEDDLEDTPTVVTTNGKVVPMDTVDDDEIDVTNTIEEDEEEDHLDQELARLDEMDEELLMSTMTEIEEHENEEQELDESLDDVLVEDTYQDDEEDDEYVERESIIARNGIVGQQGEKPTVHSHERAVITKAVELAKAKVISQPQLKRLEMAVNSYKEIPAPHDPTKTVAEVIKIDTKELVLEPDLVPDMPEIRDKSFLKSTVGKSNENYIKNILPRDVLGSIMGVQQSPVAVTDIETHKVIDAVSDYTVYRVSMLPVTGKASRIEFRLPNVKPDGKFMSNGNWYRMRPQRTDLPIVKVSATRVALNTAYGKLMVELSQKVRFNYEKFVGEALVAKATDNEDLTMTDPSIVNVAVYDRKLPKIYNIISRYITSFTMRNMSWQFDYVHREFPDDKVVQSLEKDGYVVVASNGTKHIVVDYNDVFYEIHGKETTVLGKVEDVFGLPVSRMPLPMVELRVFGKDIPIGVVLAYLMGLDNLLQTLQVKYRTVTAGDRLNLLPDEYAIQFKDDTLIFDRNDAEATLLMSGFTVFAKYIRQHNVSEFNRKLVYNHVLDQSGINLRYVRELDLLDAMFVDPISRDILEWMREPTEFRGLLRRATQMLMVPYVPKTLESADGLVENLERTRGYERFASVVYNELVKSMRSYNTRNITNNSQIQMNPHAVWTRIVSDGATTIVNELNPIENLREIEVITYGGDMGRSKRSMTAPTRVFKETDVGVLSEVTPDSGDVGITSYRTPNTAETTLRGTVRLHDREKDGVSSLFSTTALLMPSAERDDSKRINLGAGQQAHFVAVEGAQSSPLRTGYEHVIAHRVDGTWTNVAAIDGKVTAVSDTAITIQNKDGTDVVYPLGRSFGYSVGTVIPHQVVTQYKVGDTVKKGDVVTYNSGYFEPSLYTKGQVAWMGGLLATVAILEAQYTIEDSSAISMDLAKRMSTSISDKKPIQVRFDQSVTDLVKVGDKVDLDTPLCVIEDDFIARGNLYSDMSEEQLRYMQAEVPRAGRVGVVERVEVFYHGDTSDMSESLQRLVAADERRRKAAAKELKIPYISGQVDQSLRIRGEGLPSGHAVIFVYITYKEAMQYGDRIGSPL